MWCCCCSSAQCSVTEARSQIFAWFHHEMSFLFCIFTEISREKSHFAFRAVYPLIYTPRLRRNPQVKENLSDSEVRCISHQLGKFGVGCHSECDAESGAAAIHMVMVWVVSHSKNKANANAGVCTWSSVQALQFLCQCLYCFRSPSARFTFLAGWPEAPWGSWKAAKLGLKKLHTFSHKCWV